MASENAQSQMRKGILEYCVLGIIAQGEIYSSDIIDLLKQGNLLVAEGTLYPMLSRLKNSGLVGYKWVESTQGPPRKYFTITDAGENYLQELDSTWNELITTINSINKKRK